MSITVSALWCMCMCYDTGNIICIVVSVTSLPLQLQQWHWHFIARNDIYVMVLAVAPTLELTVRLAKVLPLWCRQYQYSISITVPATNMTIKQRKHKYVYCYLCANNDTVMFTTTLMQMLARVPLG